MSDIYNALSVDVEDYFQVLAFEDHISRDNWDKYPARIEGNIDKILSIFNEYNVTATFFVLGWIAERYPELVRLIADSGHELASHGYSHERVTQQTPKEFRDDISKTKIILEDISGIPVAGYRAASYSINSTNHWAHEELEKTGHKYSSSIYPIKHDIYGVHDAPRFVYKVGTGSLLEIPISTLNILNHRVPIGGGGYFRLYPYFLSRFFIEMLNKKEQKPCVFYFHPWEIDHNQPKQNGISTKTRFRHYINLSKTEGRIKNLLKDFNWSRMDKVFNDEINNLRKKC